MRSSRSGDPSRRVTGFEVLEDRRVLAADFSVIGTEVPQLVTHEISQPVTHDFTLSYEEVTTLVPAPVPTVQQPELQTGQLETHLNGAHAQTGVDTVKNTYGFDGTGQTVAIIDTGIAWDHLALGAGYGEGYRVVGGWDFAENDANPYDDGPAGYHGTHVAGIVGSDNSTYEGVAPGVDLVALRVFDDQGGGNFAWVEQALQWLHTHRNDFENPITTVNLSLGAVNWNSDTIPSWAMLEDEFAQLEADGMFISVSAGNSFQSFGQTGLSYPAGSQYVVPVASVDANGNLSSFSQRNDRVLAAPGENIASTVPDHIFGADGYANDFGNASGTSMAAPYVAGSAVLVRQAMEFAGYQNITQDMIYDHFRDTADMVYDSVTSAWYHRINVERAIAELMPADEYGNTSGTATGVGEVGDGDQIQGALATLNDTDYIRFTAAETGTLTLTGSGNNGYAINWSLVGSSTSPTAGELAFDVVAGEEYVIAVSSSAGIGHYSFTAELEAAPAQIIPVDLGTVDFMSHTAQGGGTQWFAVTASNSGLLSVGGSGTGNTTLTLYNSSMSALGSNTAGAARVDCTAVAGETYYVEVTSAGDVDLDLVNLVSLDGGVLTVNGTSGNDTLRVDHSTGFNVSVNDFAYSFTQAEVSQINVDGQGGTDVLTVNLGSTNDTATVNRTSLNLSNSQFSLTGSNLEGVTLNAGGGTDSVALNGWNGDEKFVSDIGTSTSTLTMGSVVNKVTGFESVTSNSVTGGNDFAYLYDGAGDDVFTGGRDTSSLVGSGVSVVANNYGWNFAYARNGGNDRAVLQDTTGNDALYSNANYAMMTGSSLFNLADGFETVEATSTGGSDSATMVGSSGNDRLVAQADKVTFTGSTFNVTANKFGVTNVTAGAGGVDHAFFYDSSGADTFVGGKTSATMSGVGFSNTANGFGWKFAYSVNGGTDTAIFQDSAGNDNFMASQDYAIITGSGLYNYARGFSTVTATATGGIDSATLIGTTGNDRFVSDSNRATLTSTGYAYTAQGFDSVHADAGGGGVDHAFFYDSAGNDVYTGGATTASMVGSGFNNSATGFGWKFAYSKYGGNDQAIFNGTTGDDTFYSSHAYAMINGKNLYNYAQGFKSVVANSGGGNDTANLMGDTGNDRFVSQANSATLSCSGCSATANNFAKVTATAGGGVDHAFFYDSAGNDVFTGGKDQASMVGSGFNNVAVGFGWKFAYSMYGGSDTAIFQDSAGNDTFTSSSDYAMMYGSGLYNYARGFTNIQANSTGGVDSAYFKGSNGTDTVSTFSGRIEMQSAGKNYTANGFAYHEVDLAGGDDLVYLYEMLGETLNELSGEINYARSGGASERFLTNSDFAIHSTEEELADFELENLDYVFETL